MRYFFFGLLCDRDILALVRDHPADDLTFRPARLPGYRTQHLMNESFPGLVADPDSTVSGVLVDGLSEEDSARIAFYESVEYAARTITVRTEGGVAVDAQAFLTTERYEAAREPWSFERWRERYKEKDLRETRLWMALYGYVDAEEADRLWDEATAAGDRLEALVTRMTSTAPPDG